MGILTLYRLPRKWLVLLAFLCVLSCCYFMVISYFAIDIRPHTLFYSIWEPVGNQGNGVTWRQLALQVAAVRQELETARINGNPPSLRAINDLERILGQLDSTMYDADSFPQNDSARIPDVCPEVYANASIGWPFYDTGWVMESCSQAPPLEDVISVVLNPSDSFGENCAKYLSWVLQGINESYPSIPVYVADKQDCKVVVESYPNVHRVPISASSSASSIWKTLISSVKTPYVFVGRELFHFTYFAQLERQIRIISGNRRVRIAGGAIRNITGHWRVGCFQTSISNYNLKYVEGYYVSKNECMFCDHLAGPFVAKTDVFQEILLDTSLPEEIFFHDFFLQVKNAGYLTMNCPDVMYFANDKSSPAENIKQTWIMLVKKWELNQVLLPQGIKHSFTCEESGISCKFILSKVRSFLLPPCCLSQFITGLKVLRDLGIPFEIDSGTVLGAVKMQGCIPWDIDTDTTYLSANHSFLLSSKERIARLGLQLVERTPVSYDSSGTPSGGYFMLWTPDGGIEMYGQGELSSITLLPPELRSIPTKVELDGEWFDSPASPGLWARNRYGAGILKHAQSWRHQGLTSSFAKYNVGTFLPCQKINHHACLDRFAGDGNIQFKTP